MLSTTILSATLALAGLASAQPSVYTWATRGSNSTCTMKCGIDLAGQYDCKGRANFDGACYQRGVGEETQPVEACEGISVRYIVDGKEGPGSGKIEVIKTVNENVHYRSKFNIWECRPGGHKGPLGIPCSTIGGSCPVSEPR